MSEREIIAITGTGGSGKTNLARGLKKGLSSDWSLEHISFGEYVRQQAGQILPRNVARSAFRSTIIDHLNGNNFYQPFDEPTTHGILHEILDQARSSVLLLDGYPRYTGQLSQLQESAIRTEANLSGVVVTYVNDEEAIRRIRKREDERSISAYDAQKRIHQQRLGMEAVCRELSENNIQHTKIDTYFPKEHTLIQGYRFVDKVISTSKLPYPNAS